MLNQQPVETTLYSLDESPPKTAERRGGPRYMSLLRVGSLTVGDRRELCLIRNISAGGMLIRAYCPIEPGTPITIELKQGEPIGGVARWVDDECVGVTFDSTIDVIALLSTSMQGPRPRMPRVEVACVAWLRDDGTVHRARAVNVSQGGARIETAADLSLGAKVIVTLTGLAPAAGVVRWKDTTGYGITFNKVLPLPLLVGWLQEQSRRQRAAC